MNFILNQNSEGNTPIQPEEAEQLIPRISTTGELNEYEALNIVTAQEWAFNDRTMKSTDPLEESYNWGTASPHVRQRLEMGRYLSPNRKKHRL